MFGGTFDPPHVAHMVLALDVREALALDLVLVVVAGEPWQKVGSRHVTRAELRLAMVEAAVEGVPGLEACDLEVRRSGPSYTVDTLREIAGLHPGSELFLILGSDAASGLDTWESAEELPAMCRLVVVERPGAAGPIPARFGVDRVDTPLIDLSSTDLRERAASGRSLRFLVPEPVRMLIESSGLYGELR